LKTLEKGMIEKSYAESVRCPICGSVKIWRSGLYRRGNMKIQRYLCRECSYRFIDPRYKRLNTARSEDSIDDPWRSRVQGEKGLETRPLSEPTPAGGVDALLLNFALWLKRQGLAEKTVENYVKLLRLLIKRGADLRDPESVQTVLAESDLEPSSKETIVSIYSRLLEFTGNSWIRPKYRPAEKFPFIPTEEELDALIAGSGRKTAALLQFLKETGARIGEVLRLRWTDIDFERRLVRITPEKGSKPRILPISRKLIGMLNALPRKSERVFPTNYFSLNTTFYRTRKRLAAKLNNPRLLKITFHTFRHWKATIEYHRTRDILYVKELLGHKRIENTMVYIDIERALFKTANDEFIVKAARSDKEAMELLEVGFEYVMTTPSGTMLFRKRK